MFSALLGFWPHILETMPHICPSDLLCVLFGLQPLSVNDELTETSQRRTTTLSNQYACVGIFHSAFNSTKSVLLNQISWNKPPV